jgi:hypothetical protein
VIDYQLDIKPLEDEGLTDEQIAQHLASRTLRPMQCSSARIILQETGAVTVDPVVNARDGLLIDHYEEMEDSSNKKLLAWFINHVMGEGEDVSTNEYPRSVQWASVTASMSEELQEVVALLVESAGGQPDAETEAPDVAEYRAGYTLQQFDVARVDAIQQLKAEIENTWINPALSDFASTVDEVRAAIKAGL